MRALRILEDGSQHLKFLNYFICLKIGIHVNRSSHICWNKFMVTLRFLFVGEDRWGAHFTVWNKSWAFRQKNGICRIFVTNLGLGLMLTGLFHLLSWVSATCPDLLQREVWAWASLLVTFCHLVASSGLQHCALSPKCARAEKQYVTGVSSLWDSKHNSVSSVHYLQTLLLIIKCLCFIPALKESQ